PATQAVTYIEGLNSAQRAECLSLADSHHVVLRALRPAAQGAILAGNSEFASWANAATAAEEQRIDGAIPQLHRICNELEAAACPVTVIKSLDHWPDLGNDLDLYSSADPGRLARILTTKFNAETEARSWGDRLAGKWNFRVP